jgi:electron transfer flavoprotein-quinone oxidoreductase
VETFEAVVVGAGPAGSAAAYELARNGVQVLVLERGKAPGAKNATGGIIYGQTNTPYNLDYLFPQLEGVPLERRIDSYVMHNMSGNKVKSIDLTRLHEHKTKFAYSVLRGKFDAWFAQQAHREAERNGGGLLSDIEVTGPLMEGGRIVGVETNELESIKADVVIAADGATSVMARRAGLRPWGPAENWFQGVKVVARVSPETLRERFGATDDVAGSAHLYAGDVFGGARGGGFLYTNKDTLSIGTVFHLDSLAKTGVEPHKLMDRLIQHPLLARDLADSYEELEYSAKLIPDGKKMAIKDPVKDRLIVIGDASGQMKAAGPIIKGMNLGITAGVLAAQSYLEAKRRGHPTRTGALFSHYLRRSRVHKELFSPLERSIRAVMGTKFMLKRAGATITKPGGWFLKSKWGQKRLTNQLNSYRMASSVPDHELMYVEVPSAVARELGAEVSSAGKAVRTRTLDERIGKLDYDTDIGRPHIVVRDNRPEASGLAVTTCPVSSRDSSRGCYRFEEPVQPDGSKKRIVVLDTQPCVECGTCAVMAATDWNLPRGGKGVQYKWG